MESKITSFLQPPNDLASQAHAFAIISSKYPSLEQLQKADDLGEVVRAAQLESETKEAQLRESSAACERHIQDALASSRDMLHTAQELSLIRHGIADEQTALAEELVPDATSDKGKGKQTLLQDLEELHERLGELERARTYVRAVERCLVLSESAVQEIRSLGSKPFTPNHLSEYVSLQTFVESVIKACAPAEVGSTTELQLVEFLKSTQHRTWRDIKGVFSAKLLTASEKLHWPMPVDYFSHDPLTRSEFEGAFLDLLRLQEAGGKVHGGELRLKGETAEKDGLYPLQTLVQPIALRFKYHFEGKRETNRLDKPEWYFTNILNVTHEHRSFVENQIQALIHRSSFKDINAMHEFQRLLLPILSRKLRHTIPALLDHPSLLAHTIYQTLLFDGTMRDGGFSLEGTLAVGEADGDAAPVWEGLSEVVLGNKEWFDTWLEAEKKFTDIQYNDIIGSPDAWILVEEDAHAGGNTAIRPTNSARRLKALIERVTERYQPLPQHEHQTRFLMEIQVPVLDSYRSRISSSLDAYETLSSSFVRAVPGALAGQAGNTARLTSGVDGLSRLVKALASTKWMISAMEAWGEDLFFLELWTEMNERQLGVDRESVVDSTMFGDIVAQYTALVDRVEGMIVHQVRTEVETGLKEYLSSEIIVEEPESTPSIAPTLLSPLSVLSTSLAFLARSLPSPMVTPLYRRIASTVGYHITQRVVLHRSRGRFTEQTGKAFAEETKLWLQTSEMGLGGSARRPELPWASLTDSAAIVSIGADSIQRVIRAVFEGDEEAFGNVREELGIRELSRAEMQDALRAREECWR
ncbi:hypothetical protein BOTBODRAFT_183196 [Botryobasidium botryosum FD-172 SS1]|uniref:RINT-1 family protein n=1 Tax=Botryobasidium botryosum (strain FD-172 SS1) TaxID=930990 RepID=A0A067N0E4_BOTB1|nr:hypothetical protein BOTBODRAFT_183196 [Botryobasidium botryosum FD-172 SS1]